MNVLKSAALCSLLALGASPSTATQAPASDVPYGLWLWEAPRTSNAVSLEIVRDGNAWISAVNGTKVIPEIAGQNVSLNTPEGDRFEGTIARDGSRITGYWIQPQSRTGYSDMATRVTLAKTGSGRWEGAFREQDRPFRVYLELFEDAEGEPRALLRNPERNEILRSSGFLVEAAGQDTYQLSAGSGERRISFAIERLEKGTLSVPFRRFEDPLIMRRANAEEALAFTARPANQAPARYTPPAQLDDGWTVASASDVGFDAAKLDAMIGALAARDPRSSRPNLMHSVLVSHRGKLVIEEYFHGYDRNTPHDIRSVGKVFGPILIGALRHDGSDIVLSDTPLPRILASGGMDLDDPRKAKVTLEQILSFSSGLDCDDNRNSPAEEDNQWTNGGALGFWRYTAAVPMVANPGERYAYCSAGINMAGFVIREAAPKPILDVFHEQIAEPLRFGQYHWNLMPDGEAYLAGGAYILPRDLLKLGELHASGGVWNGQRILSRDWVNTSTKPRIAVTPQTTAMTPEAFDEVYAVSRQALGWREHDIVADGRSYRSFEITGNGGQYIIVVPELELSVVFTGGNYRMGYVWGRWRDEYVGEHLIPALQHVD